MAQIVSGVGFLGAGAILHSGTQHVIGLTTAAWIWFTAAIGIFIGIGHGPAALFTTLSLVLVITLARTIEHRFFSSWHRTRENQSNAPAVDKGGASTEKKMSDKYAA